jgi:arabinofuranan 3-O-arabinosyltransferase
MLLDEARWESPAAPRPAADVIEDPDRVTWHPVTRRRGPWVPSGRPMAIAVGVPMLVTALIVQTWMRPGTFLASGDRGPFLLGLDGVTRLWGHTLAGTGSTTYEAASTVERALHDLVLLVGGSSTAAERLLVTLVFSVTAGAVAWLAAAFVRRPPAAAAAGLVVVLSPFTLTTLPNLLPVYATGAVALLVGAGVRAAQGRPVPAATAGLIGFWLAVVARNPPLLALVAVAGLFGLSLMWRAGGAYLLRWCAWLAAGSLFWAVPLLVHFGDGAAGLVVSAATDPDRWSWTHRNLSLPNAATFTAPWFWGDPEVNPATAELSRSPWPILRFALPILAVTAVFLSSRRRTARSLLGAAIALVVLSTGFHEPFGPLNRLLFEHVPGWWLFREPSTKFGVPLLVVVALLVALAVDGMADCRRWALPGSRVAAAGLAILGLCVIAFAHPLWLGSAIPGERERAPSGRVAVPAEWQRIGDWLDRAPGDGSVLVLPLSEYYQRGTTWGYYGVDDLVDRVTTRPALFLLPEGYYAPPTGAVRMLHTFEQAVLARNDVAAGRLFEALGSRYLMIRTDHDRRWGVNRTFQDGAALLDAARSLPGFRVAATFEHATILTRDTAGPMAAYERWVDLSDDADDIAAAVAASPASLAFVDDDGRSTAAVALVPDGDEGDPNVRVPGLEPGADASVSVETLRAPTWAAMLADGRLRIELRSGVSVDGDRLTSAPPLDLRVGPSAFALEVDGLLLPLEAGPVTFQAAPGSPLRVVGGQREFVDPSVGLLGNCNNRLRLPLERSGIDLAVADDGFRLEAPRDSACLITPVAVPPPVAGHHVWRIQGRFRSDGAVARTCLWLGSAQRCADGSSFRSDEAEGEIDLLASVPDGDRPDEVQLVVYADHPAGARETATVGWSDLTVVPLRRLVTTRLSPPVDAAATVRPADGRVAVTTSPADRTNHLGPFAEELGDCNRWDDTDQAEAGISRSTLPDQPAPALELRARIHSACVWAPIALPMGIDEVELQLEHRTLEGRSGRWSLVDRAGGSTLAGGSLPRSSSWQQHRIALHVPRRDLVAAERDLWLYLYADGAGTARTAEATTVVQYRAVAVRTVPAFVASVVPASAIGDEPGGPGDRGDTASPVLEQTGGRTATLRSDGSTLVVLREAWAPRWELEGLPEGASARHVVADGWANGWVVDGLGGRTASLRFAYGPERLAGIAVWSAALVLPAALVALGVPQLRRRFAAAPARPRVRRSRR